MTPQRLFAILLFVVWPLDTAAQRLPLTAVPEHYRLHFVPDLEAERFRGRETIRIRILAPSERIVLHAAGLDVSSAHVKTGSIEQPAIVSVDARAQTATLSFSASLQPGPAEIRLSFSGVLNRELRGFYISEAGGRKYAVTQLEAADARRMFPSFDEPMFKSTFDISVQVDEGDYAISNGAVERVQPGGSPHTQIIDFATTPRMSTYLVALAVGDFECAGERIGETAVRVCATPGKKPLTRFALDATRASLEYFNQYFAIDYPFGKLDLVAIPDFAAGAMENTGAVFFRESLLLVAPGAALPARKRAATVIAHELAHQWFGNLVTMRWWDDLWLNEGFATWMEVKAVQAWRPAWDLELDERLATESAMAVDALFSTRAVRTEATTPEEIEALFDPIAYEKAAAVLAMVEAFVGEDAFRKGINAYLHQFQYDNATAENFWTLLTRATGHPVDRIMSSFVDQPGVPLVTVSTACERDRTVVTLSQERFKTAEQSGATSSSASGPDNDVLWTIPVCVGTRGDAGANRCELLDERHETVQLPGCAPWVIANVNAEGYYRTRYAPAALDRLATADAGLRAEERLMIVADLWALLRAGRGSVGDFLDVVSSLAMDIRKPAVLEAAAARLQFLHEYVVDGAVRDAFERWVRAELAPMLPVWETKQRAATLEEQRARAARLSLLGAVGRDPEVLADARTTVDDYLSSPPSDWLSPTLLNVLVPLAALEGGRGCTGNTVRVRSRRSRPKSDTGSCTDWPPFVTPNCSDAPLPTPSATTCARRIEPSSSLHCWEPPRAATWCGRCSRRAGATCSRTSVLSAAPAGSSRHSAPSAIALDGRRCVPFSSRIRCPEPSARCSKRSRTSTDAPPWPRPEPASSRTGCWVTPMNGGISM